MKFPAWDTGSTNRPFASTCVSWATCFPKRNKSNGFGPCPGDVQRIFDGVARLKARALAARRRMTYFREKT